MVLAMVPFPASRPPSKAISAEVGRLPITVLDHHPTWQAFVTLHHFEMDNAADSLIFRVVIDLIRSASV